jgi:Fungal Zn(2)-Cys(6) binuclear cluster domain
MDIQGLVNHTEKDERPFGSLSPPDNSGSDSARSQFPADSVMPQLSPYALQHRDREEIYSPHYQRHNSITSPSVKRQLDNSSLTLTVQPAKRRLQEVNGEVNGKGFPTRRRALQACEACRAKKSKCDNERPSCGSCIQHAVECVYKGAPFVTVYDTHELAID